MQAESPLAMTHNDQHVNENHHLASAFSMLQQERYAFMHRMDKQVGSEHIHVDCLWQHCRHVQTHPQSCNSECACTY